MNRYRILRNRISASLTRKTGIVVRPPTCPRHFHAFWGVRFLNAMELGLARQAGFFPWLLRPWRAASVRIERGRKVYFWGVVGVTNPTLHLWEITRDAAGHVNGRQLATVNPGETVRGGADVPLALYAEAEEWSQSITKPVRHIKDCHRRALARVVPV